MTAGYQSNIRLDELVFTGNVPLQYSQGDFGTAVGTGDYTLSLKPAISNYTNGMTIKTVFTASNTGAVSLNVNEQGAVPVRYAAGGLLIDYAENELLTDRVYVLTYLNGIFQIVNPMRKDRAAEPAPGSAPPNP